MNLTNFDRIIVQSWHRNGEGDHADTSVPRNIPEHVDAFEQVREIPGCATAEAGEVQ